MASWDTPVVSAPKTADYAAPLVDFSKVSNLVDDAYKGKQMFREEQKANLFRNGIPRVGGGDTGDYDLDKIATQAAKVGGYDYAKPFIDLQVNAQNARTSNKVVNDADATANGVQPSAAPAPYGQPAPSPRAITPLAPSQGDSTAPTSAATQPKTVMTILAAQGIPNDQLQAASESVARQLGVSPTDTINTGDPQVRNVLGPAIQRLKGVGQVVQPSAPAAAPATQTAPVAPAPPAAAPNQRVAEGFNSAPASPQVAQLQAQADRYGQAEQQVTQQAVLASAQGNKQLAEELKTKAGYYHDLQKGVLERVAKEGESAPSIKEWRQSGSKVPYDDWVSQTEGAKENAKVDAKANSTKYEQFVENGKKAQMEIPQLELLQEQMNDPNFFSGAGEKYNLLYKRLKSAVGMDPDAAVPQELLRKVTASNVLGSLGALKGLGPIRVAEMNMAREAAAAPDNSIPANKMLVEISKRTHQRNAEIAEMAQSYKDQNGALDPAFDKKVTQYYKDHPLFSDVEIKDWHKIIGEQKAAQAKTAQPAAMPTFATPDAVHAAISAGQLKNGDQFIDANGVPRKVP